MEELLRDALTKSSEKPPIVVILGPTGVGKSRLAVHLAHLLPSEIISADSMQVYRGLDILTNKVTLQEREGVCHHLLDIVDLTEEFTVRQFRDIAVKTISEVIQRGRLPIVVGGTNYYIQALVSSYLLDDYLKENKLNGLESSVDKLRRERNARTSTASQVTDESQYERLIKIDPEMGCKVHPNDSRKLKRYLEIYEETGIRPSELFAETQSKEWGTARTSRYNCCLFSLDAETTVLDSHVDERVESMLRSGLLDEVAEFYAPNMAYTQGLHQAIGVEEFAALFNSFPDKKGRWFADLPLNRNGVVMEELKDPDTHQLKCLFDEAVHKMKINTHKLARSQKRRISKLRTLFGWEINCLDITEVLKKCDRSDGGDKSGDTLWRSAAIEPAFKILKQFLASLANNEEIGHPQSHKKLKSDCREDQKDPWVKNNCEACGGRLFIGVHQWRQHIDSRSHKRQAVRLKKKLALTNVPKEEQRGITI